MSQCYLLSLSSHSKIKTLLLVHLLNSDICANLLRKVYSILSQITFPFSVSDWRLPFACEPFLWIFPPLPHPAAVASPSFWPSSRGEGRNVLDKVGVAGIRITFKRSWIHILFKVMVSSDPPGLHCGRPRLYFEPLKFLNLTYLRIRIQCSKIMRIRIRNPEIQDPE
jgi:hypothetical protein